MIDPPFRGRRRFCCCSSIRRHIYLSTQLFIYSLLFAVRFLFRRSVLNALCDCMFEYCSHTCRFLPPLWTMPLRFRWLLLHQWMKEWMKHSYFLVHTKKKSRNFTSFVSYMLDRVKDAHLRHTLRNFTSHWTSYSSDKHFWVTLDVILQEGHIFQCK